MRPTTTLWPGASINEGNRPMFAYCFARLECVKVDRKGVTALEYGILASLIAVVMIAGATNVGTKVLATFTNIASALP